MSLEDPDSLERLITDAARGADGTVGLLSVSQLARIIGKKPAWVYRNARWLGAVRLGPGPKAPLAFDPRTVAQQLAGTQPLTAGDTEARYSSRTRRRRRAGRGAGMPSRAPEPQVQSLAARDRWATARTTDAKTG